MNADARLDPPLRRQAGVALDHGFLHLDGAAHRLDNASEFDDASIASPLDGSAMMHCSAGKGSWYLLLARRVGCPIR